MERIQRLVIDAGFTCPNRDGTLGRGGCTFCDNAAFHPAYSHPGKSIREQIDDGIAFHRARGRKADGCLAYFQSFTNTYGPVSRLRELYGEALSHPAVRGLVIGTRPDCVDEEKLDLIASLPGKVILEFGIESCYDRTLERVNRGHTFEDARRAVRLSAEREIDTRAHFILGLPGETREMLLGECGMINELPLTGIKLHQLQILKGTPMALEYEKHPEEFLLPDLPDYIELLADLLERLRPDLRIDRLAAAVPPRFLAVSPWSGARPDRIRTLLDACLARRGSRQGRLFGAGYPL
ncbi:MAG: TIGR01212 family radical SAM protein [Bacteroidales bacterium]|nr:TIGR01212 family radical SAM protein [Bacteroidales bacterium]